MEKEAAEGVLEKCCTQTYRNHHRKTPVLESLFNKVADLNVLTTTQVFFH